MTPQALAVEESRVKLPRQVKNIKNTIEIEELEDEVMEREKRPKVTKTGKKNSTRTKC